MKVLGLIPARGGSKGVPGKNLRLLAGKPLLQYTAEAALAAERLSRVVLSTDDEDIARAGRACGLEVPFLRPPTLARDNTPTLPVVQHVVRSLEAQGDRYDAVCLLQPTNPLRLASDIDGAVALMEARDADSVIAFCDVGEKHPARMKFVAENGLVTDPSFAEAVEGQRRQDLLPLYLREGSIYLTQHPVLMERGSFQGERCFAWIIPPERACNIDTELDLILAEALLKHLNQ
jgi:CMP-N-acetylneuraminic acid synthetase